MEDYASFATAGGESSYRASARESLLSADAVVFDCDGTLVDIRNSYDEAIFATTSLIFRALTGIMLPRERLREALFELRRSGGFNRDTDSVYCLLLALLTGLPDSRLGPVASRLSDWHENPSLIALLACPKAAEYGEDALRESLADVLSYVDDRGVRSVEEGVERLYRGKKKGQLIAKIVQEMRYSEEDPGPVSRIFDEMYLGSELYSRASGERPLLRLSRGLIANEKMIIDEETVGFMKRRYGARLGLSTGRSRLEAEFVLSGLLKGFFAEANATFTDDVLQEYRRRKAEGTDVWPGKPDPYPLRRTLAAVAPRRGTVYVGDSMEDFIMASKMEGFEKDVHFVGVYGHTLWPHQTKRMFMEAGAAAVLHSVNELKELLL